MKPQRFVLKSSEIVGAPPTVRSFNPDCNFADYGINSVSLTVAEGKVPRVVIGLDVRTVDVELASAQVLVNARPMSVEHAVQMYKGLEQALVKLGVLVPEEDAQEASGGLIVPGSGG